MINKKIQLNDSELNTVAGGSWEDMYDWFRDKLEKLNRKHHMESDHTIPDLK